MEQVSFTRSKSDSISSFSSFSSILSGKEDRPLLPLPAHQKPKIRVRTLLSHCLYRRVIIWTVALLFLIVLGFSTGGVQTRRGRILDLVDFRKGDQGSNADARRQQRGAAPLVKVQALMMFASLDGFFTGIKALVPVANYTPEYPRASGTKSPFPITLSYTGMPTPTPFVPQPDYKSSAYTEEYEPVKACYLDSEKTFPAPSLYAYSGIVQGQPEPVIGSYKLLGLRDDVCFDRFGRYGPYGLGYSTEAGGVEEGMDTEKEGSEAVWKATGKIDYSRIDWAQAQDRCFEANKHRFVDLEAEDEKASFKGQRQQTALSHEKKKLERIAVVVRTYVGFQWTQHAILNFRAMISELAIRSGGEYHVHFLLHVRDNDAAIWADAEIAQRILDDNVPEEFHGLCTLWSEAQMKLLYPGDFGSTVENPSNADIHGVYRSAHMPLQHFAITHPQYAHYWNWEMDMRWLGDYYELFNRLGNWARDQKRVELWERSSKYYIPYYHNSFENFTEVVHNETEASGRRTILGPVIFAGRQTIRSEERGQTFLPPSCSRGSDMKLCGVGEEADLITLNPLFDAEESGWVFASDVTGYDRAYATPPRRCAIVTASRLSRRLLQVMHEETWRLHHSMFSEMFPASMALHHGLKAAYAPHPVYLDREWDQESIDAAFNGGRDHTAGGHGSPFDFTREHNHKGASWYYNSEFSGLLWRRWLGYAQMDGRGKGGGRAGEGALRGGREEEEATKNTGRLCLRSMLVHPIKWEHPSERR
ncbi:hypothetical protein GQ53DRAFT_780798 [Thozetella sp. PMI_491]|nr:hypothetical protein GQ53DRAFT_780798 [Thozetella sp. PMI_491]